MYNIPQKDNNILTTLNLFYFKIKRCNKDKNHNIIKCVFYHNLQDKRRCLLKYKYKQVMCKSIKYNNECKVKNCNYSHNLYEILYHPENFKKKFCISYIKNRKWKYIKFCSFAHSWQELNIKLLHKLKFSYSFILFHYKTESCPIIDIKHDKMRCVYYHDIQDFKRNLNYNNISSLIECANWKNTFFGAYNNNCIKCIKCKYMHGINENKYNFYKYKQDLCLNKNCNKWSLLCNKKHINNKDYPIWNKSSNYWLPIFKNIY